MRGVGGGGGGGGGGEEGCSAFPFIIVEWLESLSNLPLLHPSPSSTLSPCCYASVVAVMFHKQWLYCVC